MLEGMRQGGAGKPEAEEEIIIEVTGTAVPAGTKGK